MTKLLMCEPEYFQVSYDINPWMTEQLGKVNSDQAQEQWYALYNVLKDHADISLIPPVSNCPDMVFTANAGLVVGDKVVLSRFAKPERQPEELHFTNWFWSQGYTIHQPDEPYEGEGDHLVDLRDRHWMGCGFRTEKVAVHGIEKYLDHAIMPVGLRDPRWYHLDTAFCPLPNGELMWWDSAFTTKAINIIQQAFEHRIQVREPDALKFACNCICIDNDLFMPDKTEIAADLRELGYRVHEFDLSEFIKAGGAAKCLVLKLAG